MLRIFFFLFGFGLMVVGFTYIILYLNLLSVGYNFLEYVNFIIRKIECLFMPIGLIVMIICVYMPKGGKDDIYI